MSEEAEVLDVEETDPFAEQPGDREPEPAAAQEPEPEVVEEEEAPAEEVVAETEEEPEPEPRKTDWRDRQIAKRNKELADAREALKAAESRSKALEDLYGKPEEERAATALTIEDARKEALAEFRRERYFEDINRAADAMFDAGAKAFPKSWGERTKLAAEMFADEIMAKPVFLETITSLDNAAQVYHDLAGDPDEMERVLNLLPHKMGIELAKKSVKLSATPAVRVSTAPAPIRPMNKATVEPLPLDDPNLSQDEFNRRMDAEEEKRAKGGRR